MEKKLDEVKEKKEKVYVYHAHLQEMKQKYSDLKAQIEKNEIHAKESGFVVRGELKIVAEIEVLKVFGKLDVTEATSSVMKTMDVSSCQWNPKLRTRYMSLLIETLRQSPHEVPEADLAKAYDAQRSITNAGFKLDWLEKKLDEMSEKKEKGEAGETRIKETEKELKDLKLKWLGLEAQLEKGKQ
ncbi:hypothetical protein EUTSA_v10006486mg, partial [Eutrema salsugineum]